jgi:hypothetical protein
MMAGEPATRKYGTGLWLLYLAWFYPCWWLAQACVVAGPELLRGGGGSPPRISMSTLGVAARSVGSVEQAAWTLVIALAVAGVCWVVARWAPMLRPAALFGLVWIAYALLGRGVLSAFLRPESQIVGAPLALAGFAGLAAALARLPLPAGLKSSTRRAATLAALVLGPLAIGFLIGRALEGGFRVFAPQQVVMVAACAAIAQAARRGPPGPASAGALSIGLGLLATVVTFYAAAQAGRALSERTEAARAASMAPVPNPAPLPPVEEGFYYKGVNFTSEWPEPYGAKSAARVLAALPAYGVNAVALVPYGSQQPEDPELNFPLRMERDELIVATAKMAHAEGLRVLLKPQVWVRGRELYPGDLRYDDPAERARWFASYTRLVEHYARLATLIEADLFCVGVEFAQLTPHEGEWRRLIALARRHYGGKLVYAANFGEEFESIQFWDALDFIGLDNYYPLPDNRSVHEIAARIEAVHRKFGKPILFTEAGFSTYELSHRKPWEDRPGGSLSPEAQARNVAALLSGYHGRDWLHGIFWWKVGTAGAGGPEDGSHILWNKPAMDVIGKWFKLPARPGASSR